ncbi:hypothetical protein EMIHUDRAFT_238083 [Emiliania huxleyi CCMP1516]|uniref:Uncharacterized protein n=2 Tax=Emiliania huxleyi TaxID=2903 RepID=A0A0D3JNB0_EMIH1|nr:hypothetical protein EMIHUDRAFT_238083 [Emiliania huxleyi CCMP1516]EOD24995.1 hypothetical protein EMIHUDRAFT_238083 [Emiliania huxleyi CCMP1516]|eukprot:XP_005777424.1 hypothetical protein EMIHUDRAFT_238083 [Emiliania huxleyi CCMP1516]
MGMILLEGSMEHMSLLLGGSVFNNIFYRLMGASVGKNAYIEGRALEYDLLSVGEGATVGRETYPQCHTVERLVIRNAPVTLESSATMRSRSVIMPGATLSKGSCLQEFSLLLKGEVTGTNEVWWGNPASRRPPGVYSSFDLNLKDEQCVSFSSLELI